ncbi:hypothetical protein BDW75DRAFT_234380 [Aspergillus navahoensis]
MDSLQHIVLTTKPTAQISYTFHPPAPFKNTKNILLVFLNGLGLPKPADLPGILTYDRYGQGAAADRDPKNPDAHDCLDVVTDLRQLLTQLAAEKLEIADLDEVKVIFVANSIGCAFARLYAQEYPGTVAGLVLLDSVLANSDFVSIFPDPDVADFDQALLPENITPEILRATRARVRAICHPVDGQGVRPVELSMAYVNPFWKTYNEGLVKTTQAKRAKGPVIAEGAGHFVQKDRPDMVVKEIVEILGRVYGDAQ